MKTVKFFILILLAIGLLSSCNYINNSKYLKTTETVINDILKEDYDGALKLFAFENPGFQKTNIEKFKEQLKSFHNMIIKNYGSNLDYTLTKIEVDELVGDNEVGYPNTTVAFIQISNEKDFGILKVWFDNETKKVVVFKFSQSKKPIPNMLYFWLIGIFAFCIPLFNIYVIIKVHKSELKMKWIKYLTIILLNIPVITYKLIGGFALWYYNYKFFFGMGFDLTGYNNLSLIIGIPIGGIYVLWQLNNENNKQTAEIKA